LRRTLLLALPALAALSMPVLRSALPAQEPPRPRLVQLRFEGQAGKAGARAQLAVQALIGGEERAITATLLAGPGTSGAELSALLAARLEAAGVTLVRAEGANASASLFLEDATRVTLELGGGLIASLTACEGSGASVRVEARGDAHPATVTVVVETVSSHEDRRGSALAQVLLEPGTPAPAAASRLMDGAAEAGLLSEKPGGDRWRPTKLKTGERVLGLSLRLESAGDWRIDLGL